jgi:hypothetical protein
MMNLVEGSVVYLIPTRNSIIRRVPIESQIRSATVLSVKKVKGSMSLGPGRDFNFRKTECDSPFVIDIGGNCGYVVFNSMEELSNHLNQEAILTTLLLNARNLSEEQLLKIGKIINYEEMKMEVNGKEWA